MLFAVSVLSFLPGTGRTWAKLQFVGALLGLMVSFIWLYWLPGQIGLSVANGPSERMTTSLSLREVLWQQSIEMIISRPLLGFGPMHFADVPNSIAAHPHQAFLQLACEWGLPLALLIVWMVWRAICSVFHMALERCHSRDEVDVLRVCLLGAVLASLMQAMFDGVLVMPYTEIWLALLGGWLFSLHPHMVRINGAEIFWTNAWRISLSVSVVLLLFVAVRDFSSLQIRERLYAESFGGHLKPRFWTQGMIFDGKSLHRSP
jgi:hypothetical protein